MFDTTEALTMLAYGGGTGVGIAVGLQFMKWLLTFLAGRMDKREEHLDGVSSRLYERMEHQIENLTRRVEKAEQELQHCTEQHAEAKAEVMELRAMMQGYGDARQLATLQVAADKKDAKG